MNLTNAAPDTNPRSTAAATQASDNDLVKPVTPPAKPKPTAAPPAAAVPQATPIPVLPARKPLLFGLGPQADSAERQRLVQEAPVKMLTSWYNSPRDLTFMRGWKASYIPGVYAKGYALHLVIWTDKPEGEITTKYGPACGRSYPFSETFAADMRELSAIYRGSGPLYVSMFTEFQTFPCKDNTWQGNENYYRALMDQYRLARDIFKSDAPNSQVSLTWGGWQARWDDPRQGGGRSLIPHFADVMNASDFQSFQAMDSSTNVKDIIDMSGILHAYGDGRVMIAHYKPDNVSQATWNQDMTTLFTPTTVEKLSSNGVFSFSFMDEVNINANEASYQQAKNIVLTYGQ